MPVRVEGRPSVEESVTKETPSEQNTHPDPVRIMADIRMTNGLHVQQRNLDYEGLKRLVENLAVLC